MQTVSDRAVALFWLASGALVLGAMGLARTVLRDIGARRQMARERRNDTPPMRFVDTLG